MPSLVRQLRTGMPVAATSAAAVLATFGSALGLKYAAGLSDSVVVLAVVLAVSMSRRQPGKSPNARWLALLVLPLVSVGATEIGTQLYQRPNLGDTLFVAAVSASIWSRRFGGRIARVGSVAALPLIAILIAPVAVAGSSGGSSRWWAAVVAVLALSWVTVCFAIAEHHEFIGAESVAPKSPAARSRTVVVDRLAIRVLVALSLSFVIGRWWFGLHWPWLVITAFVVSTAVEHGDVVWRGLQRVFGASVGTLGATLLTTVTPTGSRWAIVMILSVLVIAVWLRPINYAFWAGGVTAVLALLYGYYGERGTGLLVDRLEEIAIGAVLTIGVSWLVTKLPIPAERADPLQAATDRVLGYVNRQHGFGFRLVRRLPSGGYLVKDARREAVLVWSRDPGVPIPTVGVFASGSTPSGYPYTLSADLGRSA